MGKGDRRTKKGKRFIHSPRKCFQNKQLNNINMRSKDEQDLYEKFLARFDSIDYKERLF